MASKTTTSNYLPRSNYLHMRSISGVDNNIIFLGRSVLWKKQEI